MVGVGAFKLRGRRGQGSRRQSSRRTEGTHAKGVYRLNSEETKVTIVSREQGKKSLSQKLVVASCFKSDDLARKW